jgi:hypothetical protein
VLDSGEINPVGGALKEEVEVGVRGFCRDHRASFALLTCEHF